MTGIEAKGTLNHLTTETNLQFLLDRLTSTHEGMEKVEGIWSRSLIEMQKEILNIKDICTQSQRRQAGALPQSRSPQRRQQHQLPYERLMKPQRIGEATKVITEIIMTVVEEMGSLLQRRGTMKPRVRPDINPETEEARLQNKKLFRDTVKLKAYAGFGYYAAEADCDSDKGIGISYQIIHRCGFRQIPGLQLRHRDVRQSEKIWNTVLLDYWNAGIILEYWNTKKIFSSCFSDTKLHLVPNYNWLLNESSIIWYLKNKN